MMASVRARVLGWLASHEQGVVEDIARDVTARTADVRDELRKLIDEGHVVAASRDAYFGDRATVYRIASVAQDGPGRAETDLSLALAALTGRPQPTQEDQILSLLADGTIWSSRELHRRVFCVLHSRIASMRKKLRQLGFDIEHSGGGAGTDEHFYQLVQVAPLSEPSLTSSDRAGEFSEGKGGTLPSVVDGSLSGVTAEPPGVALHTEQLQLEAA